MQALTEDLAPLGNRHVAFDERSISTMADEQTVALRAEQVTVRFGGLTAVKNLDLVVRSRSVHALIGPNGAGKSTAVNALSGFVRCEGKVWVGERTSTSWTAHAVAKAGLARTFQNIRLFGGMSVIETILVGGHGRFAGGLFSALLRTQASKRNEREAIDEARRLIEFVGLPSDSAEMTASTLSYGHQRRVEIARALISRPRVLLLDEPLAGMNVAEKAELTELIRTVSRGGVAILLIEHDMDVIRSLADHVTVLYHGQKLADGSPDEVLNHADVQAAYLGKGKS
ncbi:ABC transporter ATP-binding protein [Burkholderia cepacia]|uniref:ABC transporter ATP-binding protein n=1 Tax=Burkholderia cepacia TaxID=292 RepID=UPI001FC82E53|nr:ABC transporter ATP-binding protein [Burkholderia cepacia]